jgi:eukaryotic-like serine/threonine-protein kinase
MDGGGAPRAHERFAVTVESIFAAALALGSPSERAAYLDRACAGNPASRKEVEELLAAHAASNPLGRPPANVALTGAYEAVSTDDSAEGIGTVIAEKYKLIELLGEGDGRSTWPNKPSWSSGSSQ